MTAGRNRAMTVRRRAARLALCTALTVAACLLAGAAAKRGALLLGGGGDRELYERYRGREGVEARFVKQLRVCDSVRLDVTVLHAATDSAWRALWLEFNMPQLPQDLADRFSADETYLLVCLGKAAAPEERIESFGAEPSVVETFSPHDRTVTIFHTRTDEESYAVRENRYFNEKIF